MYLVTFTRNLAIILAVISDSHLHTTMYFFLSILSFADIGFTSTIVPNMLLNLQTQSKVITYAGCLSQVFFFHCVWMSGQFTLDCDGLWPLCGHLSLPALHGHHEPPGLWAAGSGVLEPQHHSLPAHDLNPFEAVFLQKHEDPTLFLWFSCSPEALLFWHPHQSHSGLFSDYYPRCFSSLWDPLFLLSDFLLHPENVISQQQIQSFFHLWVSLLSGLLVLWHRPRGLPQFCSHFIL